MDNDRQKMSRKAVVLLSGGMDSSVVLAIAKQQGFEVHALTFSYGQRHSVELEASKLQAKQHGAASHRVFDLNLGQFGGSALTSETEVPKDGAASDGDGGIPATYVPARNTVFLSVALSMAEAIGAHDIFLGVSSVDYSGYPDCRPEYIEAFEKLANLATRAADGGEKYSIHAPLINLTKEETVALGMELDVDFSVTRTCYDPDETGRPCGECDACRLRLKGFQEAGLVDSFRQIDDE